MDKKVIILTGPGGAGKTTIAEMLANKRGFIFIDGDQLDSEFFPEGGQWLAENLDKLKLAHQKILNEVKKIFDSSEHSVVLDYIVFGDYENFFRIFKQEFGDNLEIKVLFPDEAETVKRDAERECWTTGPERIRAVRSEFEKVIGLIGKDNFIDTTRQTPEETVEKYF